MTLGPIQVISRNTGKNRNSRRFLWKYRKKQEANLNKGKYRKYRKIKGPGPLDYRTSVSVTSVITYSIYHKICTWFCAFLFCCFLCVVISSVPHDSCGPFTHILQGCFTGTETITWIHQWQLSTHWTWVKFRLKSNKSQESANHVYNSLDVLYIDLWTFPRFHFHPGL